MIYSKIVILMCVALPALFCNADSGDSLSWYLRYAHHNNPGIKAEFLKYQASLEKMGQASSLPDPTLETGYFIKPMELLSGNQIAEIKLMQMFPWFGTYRAAKNEAYHMAQAEFQNYVSERNELEFNVKKEYYKLFQTVNEIETVNKNIELLKIVENILLKKFTTSTGTVVPEMDNNVQMAGGENEENSPVKGMNMSQTAGTGNVTNSSNQVSGAGSEMMAGSTRTGMTDILKLQIEINFLEEKLKQLEDKYETGVAVFNTYLNRGETTAVFVPDTLPAEELPLTLISYADSIFNNPMVKMFLSDSAAYEAKISMIKKMSYPMLGAGINYSVIRKSQHSVNPMNGQDMIMPMFSISLPVYRKKYNSAATEAKLLKNASSLSAAGAANDVRLMFRQTLFNINEAGRKIELYSKQLQLVNSIMNLTIAGFKANTSGIDDVIRNEQSAIDYELRKIDATVEKNIGIARIKYLTGQINTN